jgi:hypothetical protein
MEALNPKLFKKRLEQQKYTEIESLRKKQRELQDLLKRLREYQIEPCPVDDVDDVDSEEYLLMSDMNRLG